MGTFIKGDIVVINFPFSDLSGSKRRPALVLADLTGDDVILCQITSNTKTDSYGVRLCQKDMIGGSLSVESMIRPNKIFTADRSIILYSVCKVSDEKFTEVVDKLFYIIHGE